MASIGGGIYYSLMVPDCVNDKSISTNNNLSENVAKIYGMNLGSSLRRILFTNTTDLG